MCVIIISKAYKWDSSSSKLDWCRRRTWPASCSRAFSTDVIIDKFLFQLNRPIYIISADINKPAWCKSNNRNNRHFVFYLCILCITQTLVVFRTGYSVTLWLGIVYINNSPCRLTYDYLQSPNSFISLPSQNKGEMATLLSVGTTLPSPICLEKSMYKKSIWCVSLPFEHKRRAAFIRIFFFLEGVPFDSIDNMAALAVLFFYTDWLSPCTKWFSPTRPALSWAVEWQSGWTSPVISPTESCKRVIYDIGNNIRNYLVDEKFGWHFDRCLGVAYPILSRWCWNQEGWLKAMGYSDVSGSGVIHLYSGACGFVSAWVIGPRSGRFPSAQGDPQGSILPAHSLPVPHNYLMIFIFPRNPLMNIPWTGCN